MKDKSGFIGETIMWLLITITFTFMPGVMFFMMTWQRQVNTHYLVSNTEGYCISAIFIVVGIVLLVTMLYSMIGRYKDK